MPRVSMIIPTRDRPKDLADLLLTVLDQSYPPIEVIIIDDSPVSSAKYIVDSVSPEFKSIGCKLKYVRGDDGLPAARNLGVKISEGDAILFLDDDTLLGRRALGALATFLTDNPLALGIQPEILTSKNDMGKSRLVQKFENAICKVLMLTYHEENKQAVRRSGMSIFPNNLTKVIPVQRLSGCCCCYRREVFTKFSFDTNMKRWGSKEDLDFSYRVYKKNPGALYAIPHAKITHKASMETRLPIKLRIYMTNIYWFYVFFKDIFESSILNLIAFLWALTSNLVVNSVRLIIKRTAKPERWGLIYLLGSYATAFINLKNILTARLEFFNRNLNR